MEFKDKKDFKDPILNILRDLGGRATTTQIYNRFAARYPDLVRDPYWNEIVDNDLRWRDCLSRCRHHILVPQGFLRRGSKRGTWELV